MKKTLFIIIIIILVIGVGLGAYYLGWKGNKETTITNTNQNGNTNASTNAVSNKNNNSSTNAVAINSAGGEIKNINKTVIIANINSSAGLPPLLVYKTNKDYYNYVSVWLSQDLSRINGIPDASDIKILASKDKYGRITTRQPIKLHRGYLTGGIIDNRSVFTNYTYQEYASHQRGWIAEDAYDKIIDFNPYTEMYQCGSGIIEDNIDRINAIIDNDALNTKCTKII